MNGTESKMNVVQFAREVRQEANRVTWPTQKETMVTTGMVFAMSVAAAIFFFFVDYILSFAVRIVLGLGG